MKILVCMLTLSSSVLLAAEAPLIALNFNQKTEEGAFLNKGSIGGEASKNAVSLPEPTDEPGVTGAETDKAIGLAGEQMNTKGQYPKHSRVTLPLEGKIPASESFTVAFWFTPKQGSEFQQVIIGMGDMNKNAPSNGLMIALNTSQKKRPQFRVHFEGKDFYSAPFAEHFSTEWFFAALVFDKGTGTLYVGNQADAAPEQLYKTFSFPETKFTNIPANLHIGSVEAPFSNLIQYQGSLDNVIYYNQALGLEELSKLFKLGAVLKQMP